MSDYEAIQRADAALCRSIEEKERAYYDDPRLSTVQRKANTNDVALDREARTKLAELWDDYQRGGV